MAAKAYESERIVIRFDARRCIHAAECVNHLPAVFDADRRPWIVPAGASADEVAEVVHRCPSGALTYERRDGGSPEPIEPEPRITVVRDGPLYVRGAIGLRDPEGHAIESGPRAALCRCGHSRNKPYCDNSHVEAGFHDEA